MSQTIDKINSCYPLFEQDEYQELFRNKRQLEEAHDAHNDCYCPSRSPH